MSTDSQDRKSPRLLDQVRELIRIRHYSIRTEQAYVQWIRRYILFHDKRHPHELGAEEVTAFLSHLAIKRNVAASTQNQALNAILFLYREVLKCTLPWLENVQRAKKPQRLPVVLTRDEVRAMLGQMQGTPWLMAALIYGGGLRLMECLRLRVKDVDFQYRQLVIRDAKGQKDRVTLLPQNLFESLRNHLVRVRTLHEADLREGYGCVHLPFALAEKYPAAERDWGWQYVFPSTRRSLAFIRYSPASWPLDSRPDSVHAYRSGSPSHRYVLAIPGLREFQRSAQSVKSSTSLLPSKRRNPRSKVTSRLLCTWTVAAIQASGMSLPDSSS